MYICRDIKFAKDLPFFNSTPHEVFTQGEQSYSLAPLPMTSGENGDSKEHVVATPEYH